MTTADYGCVHNRSANSLFSSLGWRKSKKGQPPASARQIIADIRRSTNADQSEVGGDHSNGDLGHGAPNPVNMAHSGIAAGCGTLVEQEERM